jgi:hypothetical protein
MRPFDGVGWLPFYRRPKSACPALRVRITGAKLLATPTVVRAGSYQRSSISCQPQGFWVSCDVPQFRNGEIRAVGREHTTGICQGWGFGIHLLPGLGYCFWVKSAVLAHYPRQEVANKRGYAAGLTSHFKIFPVVAEQFVSGARASSFPLCRVVLHREGNGMETIFFAWDVSTSFPIFPR